MPEIGPRVSGDGKRGVAEWPKLPRPSSTLPFGTSRNVGLESGMRCKAEFKSDGGWYWVRAVARRINFFGMVNRMPLVFFGT